MTLACVEVGGQLRGVRVDVVDGPRRPERVVGRIERHADRDLSVRRLGHPEASGSFDLHPGHQPVQDVLDARQAGAATMPTFTGV